VESTLTDIREVTEVIEKDGISNDAEIRLAWARERHAAALARLSGLGRLLIDDRKAVDVIRQSMLDVFLDDDYCFNVDAV